LTPDLIADINECGLQPGNWPDILRRMSAALGGTSIFLTHEVLDLFGNSDPWVHGYDPGVYRSAAREMLSIERNTAMRHLATARLGAPYDRREFLGASDTDPVARHFLRDAGLTHAQFCTVQRDAGSVSIVAFGRNARRADFDSREIAAIGALSRHVGLAMRMHRALSRERGRGALLAEALDRLSEGVVLIGADLRVHHANRAATRMFEADDGVSVRNGAIALRDPHARRCLAETARAMSRRAPEYTERRILARHSTGGARYVLVARRPLADSAFGFGARLLVFLSDPEILMAERGSDRIWSDFDLSRAEARVADVAHRGMSIHDMADALCLSENTVKSHLKAIYAKTGVSRQAEFVRLATASTPALLD